MSSLLESPVAAQASAVGGENTSGALARANDPATMSQSEVSAVASGTTFSGGRRRSSKKSKSKAKKSKAKKSSKRRRSSRSSRSSRSYRRPMFLL
jgi:hypothetical protein